MLSAVLQKTRENIKPGYKSRFGDLFVHGLTINGIEYEWHSKSNGVKFQAGETIWYEGVGKDAKNNEKILKPTNKAPEEAQHDPVKQQAPGAPSQAPIPSAPQPSSPVSNKTETWLRIFDSICTLKAGTAGEGILSRVVDETDKLAARFA